VPASFRRYKSLGRQVDHFVVVVVVVDVLMMMMKCYPSLLVRSIVKNRVRDVLGARGSRIRPLSARCHA